MGDIDLWLEVGATLLLGECKCSLFPASHSDTYQYERTLMFAGRQIQRKAEAVERDPNKWFGSIGRPTPEQLQVIPIVVSNLPLGTGRLIDSVPVVDLTLLVKYFADGYVAQEAVWSADEGVRARKRVHFYKASTDAPASLSKYLSAPPQCSILRPAVQKSRRPMLLDGGQVLSTCHYSVEIAEDLARQVEGGSFEISAIHQADQE